MRLKFQTKLNYIFLTIDWSQPPIILSLLLVGLKRLKIYRPDSCFIHSRLIAKGTPKPQRLQRSKIFNLGVGWDQVAKIIEKIKTLKHIL